MAPRKFISIRHTHLKGGNCYFYIEEHRETIRQRHRIDLANGNKNVERICEKDGVGHLSYLKSSHAEPLNKVQFQKLAKLYNQLVDKHAELELDPCLLFTHTFDLTLGEDPVHRITQSASNWLSDKISII